MCGKGVQLKILSGKKSANKKSYVWKKCATKNVKCGKSVQLKILSVEKVCN